MNSRRFIALTPNPRIMGSIAGQGRALQQKRPLIVRFGSKAEKLRMSTSCPLYPRKRTSDLRVLMSTRPSVMGPVMSSLPE